MVVDRRPLLVVEHEASCPPGWVGEWLAEAGMLLEVRRPYVGEVLPDGLSDHCGLLVLGGSAGANDDTEFPWLPHTRQLIRTAAAENVPTLGICLGLQLAAVALGGQVHRNPAGQQIGVLDVGWLPDTAGDPLFGPLADPRRAVQWNNDIVAVMPRGSTVLARAATGEVQAARFASRSWGVQWHPEAGSDIIRDWAEEDRDDAVERGVDLDRYLEEVAAADEEMQKSWRPLATGFAAVLASSEVTATTGRA